MKIRVMASIATILVLAAQAAFANFHLFQVEQLFSNADGTVQFIIMHEFTGSDGENLWAGNKLTSTRAGVSKTYVFNKNLPGGTSGYYGEMMPSPTANKRVLIATQGFADLHIVTPDYVIPNGFLPIEPATVDYAGVSQVTYMTALPTDGISAVRINPDGSTTIIPNLATNFAGQSASVTAVGQPAAIVPVAGVYYNPNESGSGFALDYKNSTLLVAVYSYLASGPSQWYLAAGPVTNNVFTATLDKYTGGQCISCAYKAPAHSDSDNDGMITITFTSPTTATVDLPGGRHFQIQPFFQ